MNRPGILLPLLALFMTLPLASQDCTLGLGGRDTDLIISVFQLNEAQTTQLRNWEAALLAVNDSLEARAAVLLERHPQGTPEELEVLGAKYQEVKDAMVENAKYYDRLLLGLFNERQYDLYSRLCQEAMREPMVPLQVPAPSAEEGTPER